MRTMRRRSGRGVNVLLLIWTGLLLAGTAFFFFWFLDESLPWISRNDPCRAPFLFMLPITGVHCLISGLNVRHYLRSKDRRLEY